MPRYCEDYDKYSVIPDEIKRDIILWVIAGKLDYTSQLFLYHVFTNNLMLANFYLPNTEKEHLGVYASYLYSYVPHDRFGSKEILDEHKTRLRSKLVDYYDELGKVTFPRSWQEVLEDILADHRCPHCDRKGAFK